MAAIFKIKMAAAMQTMIVFHVYQRIIKPMSHMSSIVYGEVHKIILI